MVYHIYNLVIGWISWIKCALMKVGSHALSTEDWSWSLALTYSSPMLVCTGCLFVTDYFTRTPRKLNAFRSFASVELFHFTVPDDTVVAVWNLITFKEQGGTFGDNCPDRNVTVWVSKTISFYFLRGHFRKHISGFNNKSEVSTFLTKKNIYKIKLSRKEKTKQCLICVCF